MNRVSVFRMRKGKGVCVEGLAGERCTRNPAFGNVQSLANQWMSVELRLKSNLIAPPRVELDRQNAAARKALDNRCGAACHEGRLMGWRNGALDALRAVPHHGVNPIFFVPCWSPFNSNPVAARRLVIPKLMPQCF